MASFIVCLSGVVLTVIGGFVWLISSPSMGWGMVEPFGIVIFCAGLFHLFAGLLHVFVAIRIGKCAKNGPAAVD